MILAICAVFTLVGSYYAYHAIKRTTVNSLSVSCGEAYQAQDWERLEPLAERWSRWERDKAAPLLYLAEVAHAAGRPRRAVELLDQLPEADPMTPPALVVRSSLLFEELNRPMQGAEALERAIRLDPTLVEARSRLIYFYAFTLQRRKMVDHAYEAIRTGSDLPETYVYLMAQGWLSFANAYDENTKWLRGNPDEELFLVARAIYRFRTKAALEEEAVTEHEETVPYYRKVLAECFERFPRNPELLVYYLLTSSEAGDRQEVSRLLSQAPSEALGDSRFWKYKGWLHAAQGELSEAEAAYRKALELNCYDHVAQHQLAGVLRRLRKPDEVEIFERLHREGSQLRREILQLESVDKIPTEVLHRMARHAKACGDDLCAEGLSERLREWRDPTPQPPGPP